MWVSAGVATGGLLWLLFKLSNKQDKPNKQEMAFLTDWVLQ